MMNFSFVDVKSITSDVPRSNFAEADLENLADIILKSEGIIKPVVVKATGIESFSVVDGHFEYYAAVRAKEKDARKGEMVNAFVISPKLEDLVIKQAAILRGKESSEEPVPTPSGTSNLESRLQNLELRLEKQINEFNSKISQERQTTDEELKQLKNRIPQPSHPLTLLNTLDKEELALKLQRSKIPNAEKLAEVIITAREKKSDSKFTDYRDAINSVKGLGEKRMLSIIDEWS
ncbi:MAG: ParB/Srx family N-terminal domain-containing protein [Rivularia sp. (in: cyanobacteria)]